MKLRLGFILFLSMSAGLLAQETDFSKVEIKVAKVSGNIYMLQGLGGNIAALLGDDGVVIVDDQYAPLADKISKALKMLGLTDKPVGYVINTHYHGDHTGGNAPFSKTATVIAHDNVRKRLHDGGFSGNGVSMRFERKPSAKESLPVLTFQHDVSLHLNGEEVTVKYFAHGHTDTDSIVFFKNSKVVHMGDNFVSGFPFIDVEGGGSFEGLIANLEKVIPSLSTDVKIIPGHGPISDLSDVKEFLKMLKDTKDVVKKAFDSKKTLDEMKKMNLLAPWESYGKGFINADRYLETIFYSLQKTK